MRAWTGSDAGTRSARTSTTGCRALAAYLVGLEARPVIVFGAMRDKEIGSMLREILPGARAAVMTRAPMERAALPDDLVEAARGLVPRGGPQEMPLLSEASAETALARAMTLAGPDGLVLVVAPQGQQIR